MDNALSPRVAQGLRDAGHDAVHVRDCGLASAPDEVIADLAAGEGRTIISADTDFGTILATRKATKPSFVLLRPAPDMPEQQLAVLLRNLHGIEPDLGQGTVAVLEPGRIRIRRLPIGEQEHK